MFYTMKTLKLNDNNGIRTYNQPGLLIFVSLDLYKVI